jgi:hypothetical protein
MKNCKQTFRDENPCSPTYLQEFIIDVDCPKNIICNDSINENEIDCGFKINKVTGICQENGIKITIDLSNVSEQDLIYFRYDFGDGDFIQSNEKVISNMSKNGIIVRVINTKINSYICIKNATLPYINCINKNTEPVFQYTYTKNELCEDEFTVLARITIDVYKDNFNNITERIVETKIVGDCNRPT